MKKACSQLFLRLYLIEENLKYIPLFIIAWEFNEFLQAPCTTYNQSICVSFQLRASALLTSSWLAAKSYTIHRQQLTF
jgi:hypothetical protein